MTPAPIVPLLEFHHLGVACRDLVSETVAYSALGYLPEGEEFLDPEQGVRGRFLSGPGPRLELLVNDDGSSVLTPWLKAGVKYYHQAFLAPHFEDSLQHYLAAGARLVREPVPAVAFDGRRVAFLMLRNLALIELIETASTGEG